MNTGRPEDLGLNDHWIIAEPQGGFGYAGHVMDLGGPWKVHIDVIASPTSKLFVPSLYSLLAVCA